VYPNLDVAPTVIAVGGLWSGNRESKDVRLFQPGSRITRLGGRLTPARITVLYVMFGLALLFVSDVVLPRVVTDPRLLRGLQAAKGTIEILLTAALVYGLVASAQRELQVKEQALDEAPVGVTLADPHREDQPLVYLNEGFERITGYTASECYGRNCRFLQGEHTDPEPVARLREGIDAGEPVSVELRNYRADGTPFWNRVTVTPIRDDEGKVQALLGIQRDVTERREREQRLSVLNRVLRHNLRNRLNVVLAHTTRLERPDTDREAEARAIRDATEELLRFTERIQEFDAAIVGEENTTRPVDVVGLLSETAESLRAEHPTTDVTVRGADVARVDAHVTLDAAVRELLGLVGGADGARCTVDVTVLDVSVVVEVRDHSGRLHTADLRVATHDAETSLEHLQGIELWLVRWAVEKSGGEFAVDPDADPAVVRLRLPRADDTDTDPRDSGTDGEQADTSTDTDPAADR